MLVVIPARGGSKRVPGKNMRVVGGQPLLYWTVEAAIRCPATSRVVVSSEDDEILIAAGKWGATPWRRSAALAGDEVHGSQVVFEVMENFASDPISSYVCMLLPTSPLRRGRDIEGAYLEISKQGAPAIIGVTPSQPIGSLRYSRRGVLESCAEFKINFQHQDVEQTYVVNGAIFIARWDLLLKHGTFHIKGAMPYVMPKSRSLDVNDPDDLAYADYLLWERAG